MTQGYKTWSHSMTNVSILEVNMLKNSSTLAVSVPISLSIKLGFVSINNSRKTYCGRTMYMYTHTRTHTHTNKQTDRQTCMHTRTHARTHTQKKKNWADNQTCLYANVL